MLIQYIPQINCRVNKFQWSSKHILLAILSHSPSSLPPSLPSPLDTYTNYQLVAVQCDTGWCCRSDGMIIPRSRKYNGPLGYHLSLCGYTVTCLSLNHVSACGSGLPTAPRYLITPFLDGVSTNEHVQLIGFIMRV